MAAAGTKLIAFKCGDKAKKIKITPSAGYDAIIAHVAQCWGAQSVELNYQDPDEGEDYILSPDEDLEEVFSHQQYKWKVILPEASVSKDGPVNEVHPPATADASNGTVKSPGSPAVGAASQSTKDQEHDNSVPQKKEKWTDLIPQNWQCRTSGQRHPFFISYRQASESIVARELFYQLELALMEERTHKSQEDPEVDAVHPFLDAMCLSNGQKWGINFMSGLYHSHVIILLCSDMSMERMLKADVQADNVLLEWELALQMKEERGHDILPILLSRQVEATVNGERTTLLMEFSTFDHTKFPDRPHSHPLSPGRQTIRETIKSILELNGPKVDRDADVLRIVSEAKEVLSRRRLAQAH